MFPARQARSALKRSGSAIKNNSTLRVYIVSVGGGVYAVGILVEPPGYVPECLGKLPVFLRGECAFLVAYVVAVKFLREPSMRTAEIFSRQPGDVYQPSKLKECNPYRPRFSL